MRRVAGRVSLFKEIQLGNSTSNELRGIIWEGSDLYEGKKKAKHQTTLTENNHRECVLSGGT